MTKKECMQPFLNKNELRLPFLDDPPFQREGTYDYGDRAK